MKSYLEFLSEFKPVLFINFAYTVKDVKNNEYNYESEILKILPDAVFSDTNKIYYFNKNVYANNLSLDNYSLVFFGPVHDNYEIFLMVESYCKDKNIPFLSYGAPDYKDNKIYQTQLLEKAGIQIPLTTSGIAKNINVNVIKENYTFPIVLKIANGSQGKGVELIDGIEVLKVRLKELKEQPILIQQFIENNGDYRVFYIGSQHLFNVKRKSTKDSEFRHNISLGAKFERFVLDWEPLLISKKAHECLGFYFSGVDLMQDKKTKQWYILEVNSAPQFAMTKIPDIIKIIVEHINKIKH